MKTKEEWASELVTPSGGDPIDNQEIVEGIVAEIQLDAFKAGMTKAEQIAFTINDGHQWPVTRAIISARDNLKELP